MLLMSKALSPRRRRCWASFMSRSVDDGHERDSGEGVSRGEALVGEAVTLGPTLLVDILRFLRAPSAKQKCVKLCYLLGINGYKKLSV